MQIIDDSSTFVRGDALRVLASRAGLTSDLGLARAVYGAERAHSQRKRIKAMKDAELTLLGTRGLDRRAEENAICRALGVPARMLRSPVAHLVVTYEEEPARGARWWVPVAPAGGVISWFHADEAAVAARRAVESGSFAGTEVIAVVEAEVSEAALRNQREWRWLNEDGGEALDDWEALLVIEQFLRSAGDELRDEIVWHLGWFIFGHLTPLLGKARTPLDERHRRMADLLRRALDAKQHAAVAEELHERFRGAPFPTAGSVRRWTSQEW